MSDLFLVATPIGNLEDITLRALRVLAEASVIACEDTRTTRKLLAHHGITGARLVTYNERNRERQAPALLDALDVGDVALVSDAGMPAISDPGFHLVEEALAAGHNVVPIPGASALTAAIAASGLPSRRFHYLGFLPRKAGERRTLLADASAYADTLVIFEAPHRVRATLSDLHAAFGDRRVAACRELTKLYEEIFRGSLSEALEHFAEPRGEFTLVVEGAGEREDVPASDTDIESLLRDEKQRGARARDAVRRVSELTGAPHRDVYQRWLDL